MSDVVIRVENLSKRYTLGRRQASSGDGLRHALQNAVSSPLRKLRAALSSSASSSEPSRSATEEFYALRDVSFEVKRGEVLGIIGRNGAGKSTLLKILSRITEPTSGRIGLKGRVASLLEVGTGFHPELTGRENIYLNGAILGMTRAEVRGKFSEIVEFAEVEKFLDTPVKQYSSGMYVRLAFAVAAHLEPEILIVDEVLAVGDAAFQEKCMGKLDEAASSGRTVILVSHNTNAIERLCSTALWLEKGLIVLERKAVRETLNSYLAKEYQTIPISTWKNPGQEFSNPWFTPLEFTVSSTVGDSTPGVFSNEYDMCVEVAAFVEELDAALTIGFCAYDEQGTVLFWSYHTDARKELWPQLKKGRCVLRTALPKRLLNEASYRLELIGGLTHRKWLFEPGKNPPTVRFAIRGGLSNSPLWTERRPGLFAPVLQWNANEYS